MLGGRMVQRQVPVNTQDRFVLVAERRPLGVNPATMKAQTLRRLVAILALALPACGGGNDDGLGTDAAGSGGTPDSRPVIIFDAAPVADAPPPPPPDGGDVGGGLLCPVVQPPQCAPGELCCDLFPGTGLGICLVECIEL